MKVVLVPLFILIITFLSSQITVYVEKDNITTARIDTLLFPLLIQKSEGRRGGIQLLGNIYPIYRSINFLLNNSYLQYQYKSDSGHKVLLKTQVIIILISLTIFLYSKTKKIIKKRIRYVG